MTQQQDHMTQQQDHMGQQQDDTCHNHRNPSINMTKIR